MDSNSDVPTDPDEYALYMQYGPNWRAASGRSNKRDRGGRYDRFMKFFHTTPFQPMPIETLKFENPYEKPDVITEPDWYYQLNETQRQIFDLLSNYFPANTLQPQDFEEQDFLSGVMDWSNPNTTAPNSAWDRNVIAPPYDPTNDPNPNIPPVGGNDTSKYYPDPLLAYPFTGTTKTQPYVILPRAEQTTAAYAQMAKNNAASAAAAPAPATKGGDSLFGGYGSERSPAAPVAAAPVAAAPVAAAPTLNSFIQRYERAEATGNDNPKVKTVTPIVKTTTKKVKAI